MKRYGAEVARTGIVLALFAISCGAFAADRVVEVGPRPPSDTTLTLRDLNQRDYVDSQLREVRREAEQRYPTRDEFTAIIEKLRNDIRRLEISEASIAGKASTESAVVATGLALLSVVISAVLGFFQFATKRRQRENGNGK